MQDIIVMSHLRWNFVHQRPQHLLSRLAAHYRILYFEEPVFHPKKHLAAIYEPHPNVLVWTPHTPVETQGFHDDQLPYLQPLVRQLGMDYPQHMVWFYTPMALPLMDELSPGLVVYDCMDELASFKNSPKQLLQRENALFKVADIVFTGGPSLFRAKRERHPNAHCFPSSVDTAHFAQARGPANGHPAHADIPGPRLGYYGVIDERLDMTLLAGLADTHPDWQIILVGPVVKINAADLPRRQNIHYLGQQPYADLPRFLAAWDVCLLPFARNESTRFISPTKTLEYMAAELPIVSTDIADVIELYGEGVSIASDVDEFVAACENALSATPGQRTEKIEAMRTLVAANSWEKTAEDMRRLVTDATIRKAASKKGAGPAPEDNGSTADVPAAMGSEVRLPLRAVKRMILRENEKRK
jgi:glycosyltransferase involved in cell wall biosynthesis